MHNCGEYALQPCDLQICLYVLCELDNHFRRLYVYSIAAYRAEGSENVRLLHCRAPLELHLIKL